MNMQVAKNTVVTIDYHVTDTDNEVVDEGREPIVYLHGGYDDIFPKIEEVLQGKNVGESVQIKLQPDEAFGEYDAKPALPVLARTRTVVVGAEADLMTPPEHSREIAALVPGAELRMLPDTGHMLPLERYVELNDVIKGELRRVRAGRA